MKIASSIDYYTDVLQHSHAKIKQTHGFAPFDFKRLVEYSADGLTLMSAEGKIRYINPAAQKMFGYPIQDVSRINPFSFVHEDDRENAKEVFRRLVSSHKYTATLQFRMIDVNGKIRWVEAVGRNLLRDPHVSAVVVNFRDITKRREIDEKQREIEGKFKHLFNSNLIGIFVATFEGRFVEANRAFLSMLGYSRKELKEGQIQSDLLTPGEYREISKLAVERVKNTGESGTYEKVYVDKKGRPVPVLVALKRIEDKKNLCIGFVLNISERRELEKRKDAFIAVASHELKTPVTSMKVYLDLFERTVANGDPQARLLLNGMKRQVIKMTKLIHDFLDLSRLHSDNVVLRKQRFDITELLQGIIATLTHFFPANSIVYKSTRSLYVFADRERIEQVLINLLHNAIKYSPNSGKIILSCTKENKNIRIRVKDFGIGIANEDRKKIFEKFYRGDAVGRNTYPGFGVGLYISQQIVRKHGGFIRCQSALGQGSTFSVVLPAGL